MAVVLVVDADRTFRASVREMLAPVGVQVDAAENGRAALQVLSLDPLPDLILTGLDMPVMSGWELLDVLKNDPRLSQLPVVLTAGPLDARVTGKALCALRRPLVPDSLLAVIRVAAGIENLQA